MANIPTVQEIKDQVLSDIESETSVNSPSLPVSVLSIIALAVAGALFQVYKFAQWIRRQIFVISADDDAVFARGNEYGIDPTPATKGRYTATITGAIAGTNIPAGTIFTRGNFAYEVIALAVVDIAGAATITIEPLDFGFAPNLAISDVIDLSTPVSGLPGTATVATVIQSGSNAESLEAYKQRIISRQQTPPQGGSVPDYVQWSTEVPGIVEAYPFRVGPGIVVYGITDDNTDETTRIPDSSKRTELQNYLNDPRRKPMNDNITVQPQTNVGFVVTAQNLVPNTADLKQLIENAISDYLLQRRPNLYPDDPIRLDNITESDIYAIASLSGARSVELSVTLVDTTPVVNYNLDDDELAFLDSIVWV